MLLRVRYKTCPFVQQRIRQLGESPHAAADKPKPVGAAADQGGVLGMGKWLLRKAAGVSDSNGGSERRAFPTLRFPVPNSPPRALVGATVTWCRSLRSSGGQGAGRGASERLAGASGSPADAVTATRLQFCCPREGVPRSGQSACAFSDWVDWYATARAGHLGGGVGKGRARPEARRPRSTHPLTLTLTPAAACVHCVAFSSYRNLDGSLAWACERACLCVRACVRACAVAVQRSVG